MGYKKCATKEKMMKQIVSFEIKYYLSSMKF